MWWCRSRTIASAALVAMGAMLASCGFHPLYGKANPEVVPELASIKILPVTPARSDQDVARIGQQLRNDLYTRLNPKGEPAQPQYILQIRLSESKQTLAIEKTEVATRASLAILATYTLVAAGTGEPAFQAVSRSTASYDLVQSEYANVVAAQDAETRVVKNIAGDITTQLSFHFTQDVKHQEQGGAAATPTAPPANAPPLPQQPPAVAPQAPGYPGYQGPPQGYAPPPAYPAYPSAEYPAYQAPPVQTQPYQTPYQPSQAAPPVQPTGPGGYVP